MLWTRLFQHRLATAAVHAHYAFRPTWPWTWAGNGGRLLTTNPYPICSAVEKSLRDARIVPTLYPVPPRCPLTVQYECGPPIQTGSLLRPKLTHRQPRVYWIAGSFERYWIALLDLDAPSRTDPTKRDWLHWSVGNVPGADVIRGDVLAEYIGPAPLEGTEDHRYVFLVYRQFGVIQFEEPRLGRTTDNGRSNFNVGCFTEKYGLGYPVAGLYFRAEYDESVSLIWKKMGYTS